MSKPDGYQHGVPCWVETWQPDGASAARFYAELFGWETDGADGGPFMCRLRGRDVALVGDLPPERAHLPVAWTTYVWVDDADETARRVTEAGGRVLDGPFESLDGGRILIFADPSAAVLGAWQPGAGNGAQAINEASAWSWSQLYTRDLEGSKEFYGSLFGWETSTFGEGAPTMWHVPGYFGGQPEQPVSRDVVAGMATAPDDAPARWQIDFWVDDVDAKVAKAESMGGRAVVPAYDASIFRQAVLADPQGAVFTVSRITIGS